MRPDDLPTAGATRSAVGATAASAVGATAACNLSTAAWASDWAPTTVSVRSETGAGELVGAWEEDALPLCSGAAATPEPVDASCTSTGSGVGTNARGSGAGLGACTVSAAAAWAASIGAETSVAGVGMVPAGSVASAAAGAAKAVVRRIAATAIAAPAIVSRPTFRWLREGCTSHQTTQYSSRFEPSFKVGTSLKLRSKLKEEREFPAHTHSDRVARGRKRAIVKKRVQAGAWPLPPRQMLALRLRVGV